MHHVHPRVLDVEGDARLQVPNRKRDVRQATIDHGRGLSDGWSVEFYPEPALEARANRGTVTYDRRLGFGDQTVAEAVERSLADSTREGLTRWAIGSASTSAAPSPTSCSTTRRRRALSVEKVPSVPADPSEGIVQGIVRLLARGGRGARPPSTTSRTAPPWRPTRCSSGTAPAPPSSRRAASAICSRSRARSGPPSTTSSRGKPVPLVPRHRRYEVRRARHGRRPRADAARSRRGRPGARARSRRRRRRRPSRRSPSASSTRSSPPTTSGRCSSAPAARFPSLAIVASHEVHPEFREYERLSTTVANAYLAPRMSAYVRAFRARVEALGIPARPYINQSNGGTMSVEEAARLPGAHRALRAERGRGGRGVDRGPGGLRRHRHLRHGRHQHRRRLRARRARRRSAFEREIGGVTAPRADAGHPHRRRRRRLDRLARLRRRAQGRARRARAPIPGPPCYGRGGDARRRSPTRTCVLGRLGADGLLGGAVPLDPARAEAAIGAARARARPLAAGDRAGHRPRRQREHGQRRPRRHRAARASIRPGSRSCRSAAPGPCTPASSRASSASARSRCRRPGAPVRARAPRRGSPHRCRAHASGAPRARRLPALARAVRGDGARRQRAGSTASACRAARRRLERWLDLRYVGQNFELLVPVPEETWREGDCAALRRRFLETHEQVYGFAAEDEPIQVVNVRLVARGLRRSARRSRACRAAPARTGARDRPPRRLRRRARGLRPVPGLRARRACWPASASPAPR